MRQLWNQLLGRPNNGTRSPLSSLGRFRQRRARRRTDMPSDVAPEAAPREGASSTFLTHLDTTEGGADSPTPSMQRGRTTSPHTPSPRGNLLPTVADAERSKQEKAAYLEQQYQKRMALVDKLHAGRLEHLAHQKHDREERTQIVKLRCKEHIAEKERNAQEQITNKAKRFLEPIQRCSTREEANELRAYSIATVIPHALFLMRCGETIARFRATKKTCAARHPSHPETQAPPGDHRPFLRHGAAT